MSPDLNARWQGLAKAAAHAFRPLAAHIAAHPRDDFALMFMLVDFAQLAVRYAVLLLLGQGQADRAFQELLAHGPPLTPIQSKPTFGQWTRFLCQLCAYLAERGHRPAVPGIGELGREFATIAQEVLDCRNRLAHGAINRFAIQRGEVDEAAAQVLTLIEKLGDLTSTPLLKCEDRLTFRTPDGNQISAHPFAIPGRTPETPLLFSYRDHKKPFFSDDTGERDCPEVADEIEDYFAALEELRQAKWGRQPAEIHERSKRAVGRFAASLQSDRLAVEKHFDNLPAFAGRPAFARGLAKLLREKETPPVIHLHGPRGAGKRRFLSDFTRLLQGSKVVVLPLEISSETVHGLAEALLQQVGLTGQLTDFPGGRCVIVLVGWDRWLELPSFASKLNAFLDQVRALARTCVLLVSDLAQIPPTFGPSAIYALPPMPADEAREFYEAYSQASPFLPLSEWDELPSGARPLLQGPLEIALFCESFNRAAPPADTNAVRFHHEFWRSRVLAIPAHRALVLQMAEHCLAAGSRFVPSTALSGEGSPRAIESLSLLGVIDELPAPVHGGWRIGYAFRQFDWLLKALALTALLTRPPFAPRVAELFAACDRFPTFAAALAARMEDQSAEEIESLFESVLDAGRAWLGGFVEAILVAAYSHEDSELLERLLHRAGKHSGAAVLEASGAAIKYILTQARGTPHFDFAVGLCAQLIAESRAYGHRLLEAKLRYEHLVQIGPLGGARVRDECRWIMSTATLHRYHALAHAAANLLADELLMAAPRDPSAALDLLRGALAIPEAAERPAMLIHTQLSLARLSEAEARSHAEAALSLAMRHGDWHLLAGAYRALAVAYVGERKPMLALGPGSAAIALAEAGEDHTLLAALLLDEAEVRLLLERDRRSAMAPLRRARRLLENDPRLDEIFSARARMLLARARI